MFVDVNRPEPPGHRSVVLALAKLGLVRGDIHQWDILGVSSAMGRGPNEYHRAANSLARSGAIARDERGVWYLTDVGEALHGPDTRQRGYLFPR